MKENRFEQKDNIRWKRHTKRFISSRVRGSNEGEEVSVLQSGVAMSKKIWPYAVSKGYIPKKPPKMAKPFHFWQTV